MNVKLDKNHTKKSIYGILIIVVMIMAIYATSILSHFNSVQAVAVPAKSVINDNFPSSYKGYIDSLKKAHPSWTIKAFHTNLDWNTALNAESSGTYSRVQDSAFPDAWKRLESKKSADYNAGGFVLASKAAVAYTMDPRNFLNDQSIFQFRVVTENFDQDTQEAVNEAMVNTPMKDKSYAKTITDVGKSRGVSPLFLISRIRQETGCDIINNKSINGEHPSYKGYYNFFNIGAYDDASNSVKYGLALAKSKGWNSHDKAIAGGIDWLKENYLKYGQNTVYFQKFDVANPYGNALTILSWQYMSNISAPQSEAQIAYNGLVRSKTLDKKYTFYIPVYENMPAYAAPYPGQSVQQYQDDNTRMKVKDSVAPDVLHVRSGPGTGYGIVYKLVPGEQFTRIKKNLYDVWDIIRLDNGSTGYVHRDYIEECRRVTSLSLKEKEITMKLNATHKLEYTIGPEDAYNKEVEWQTSNENIVSVSNGELVAKGGGEATITIKSKDTGMTDTCKVTVIVDVEGITLPKTEYKMMKDKTYTITPTILPANATNKEYSITSDNNGIVKVEGKSIKAVSTGSTTIKFTTEDQGKTITANVTVVEVNKEDALAPDKEVFSVDEEKEQVSKIEPETKLADIKEKISYNKELYNMVIKDLNGNVLEDDSVVGTGTTINLVTKDTQDELQTYTVIIYGDTSGDGKISPSDYVKVRNSLLNINVLQNEFEIAGDANKDGKISPSDFVKIKNEILGNKTIVQ